MNKKIFIFLIIFSIISLIFFSVYEKDKNGSKIASFMVYKNNINKKDAGHLVDYGFNEIHIDKRIKSKTPDKVYKISNPDWNLFFGLIKKHFYSADCGKNCFSNIKLVNDGKYSNYIDKKGVTYTGSNVDEYSFGVNYENNRPIICSEKEFTIENKDCNNLDILAIKNDYINKINNFLNELNFGYKYEIVEKYFKYSNTYNFNINFIIENNGIDSGWYFDFGPAGAFSLQGFYVGKIENYNSKFSFITLEKAIEYYQNKYYLYNMIPDLLIEHKSDKEVKNKSKLYITNVEIAYKKNIYKDELYIFPYYKITTDKGVFYILAIETKK